MNKFIIDEQVEFTVEAAGNGPMLEMYGRLEAYDDDWDAIVLWHHGTRTWEDPNSLQPRYRTLPKPISVQPEAEAAFVALAKALGYEVQKVAP